jgi:hypothetical protein
MWVRSVSPESNLLSAFATTILDTLGLGLPIVIAIISICS